MNPHEPLRKLGESRMSKYARTCGVKVKYASRKKAEEPGSKVYRCPFCRFFHRAAKD